jgi:hypothetical protein
VKILIKKLHFHKNSKMSDETEQEPSGVDYAELHKAFNGILREFEEVQLLFCKRIEKKCLG